MVVVCCGLSRSFLVFLVYCSLLQQLVLLVGQVNICQEPTKYNKIVMQVTDPVLSNHKNMFESILDQSSSSHLYYDLDRNQIEGADHHCEPNASPSGDSEPPNVWGTLDCPQPPETTDCKYSQREDFQLEIERVISVRKEQEAEIVSFVSNCKALAAKVPRLRKANSMQEKRWWSLSPRKTKPIDKQKLPRIHQQL